MKRTQDSKPKPRRTIATSWESGTNGPNVRVEFSGVAPDLIFLLQELLPVILAIHAHGPSTDMILAGSGWKFNSLTRKASRIRDGEGKDLFTEAVWRIYAKKYRAGYRKATAVKKWWIRREIANTLAPLFSWLDAEELRPGTRAPIEISIRNGERRMTKQPSSEGNLLLP